MIEHKILKKSVLIFICGTILLTIMAIVTNMYNLPMGFMLGYLVGIIAFMITVKFTDIVLSVQTKAATLSGLMFGMKIGVYALGLIIAFKLPMIFHFATVAVGYFIMKITIYIAAYKDKGGEWSA